MCIRDIMPVLPAGLIAVARLHACTTILLLHYLSVRQPKPQLAIKMGNNSLHYAAGWGNAGMVGMLLAEGTDYNVKNVVNFTFKGHCAPGSYGLENTSYAQFSHTHVDIVFSHFAHSSRTRQKGQTPLIIAQKMGRL